MTAEALYTMTRLAQTSAIVAVKSSLSDLSFRAMRSKVPPFRARNTTASSQQSSAGRRGKTPTSQTGAACVPSGQLLSASTGLMTAESSRYSSMLAAPPLLLEPANLLLEHTPAFGVVREHVDARTRRRQPPG